MSDTLDTLRQLRTVVLEDASRAGLSVGARAETFDRIAEDIVNLEVRYAELVLAAKAECDALDGGSRWRTLVAAHAALRELLDGGSA